MSLLHWLGWGQKHGLIKRMSGMARQTHLLFFYVQDILMVGNERTSLYTALLIILSSPFVVVKE